MDRCFVIDETALKEFGSDGEVIKYLVKELAHKNLDIYITVNSVWGYPKTYVKNGIKYKVIPVSSIEKTRKWLKDNYGVNMKPIEIPKCLRCFSPDYEILSGKELIKSQKTTSDYFIKRIDELKLWNNLLYDSDVSSYIVDDATYSVSPKRNILSEYRVFVHNDKIVGCQPYITNTLAFPNVALLETMVDIYKEQDNSRPRAYTLDIAVRNREGLIMPLEVHPFVSCGLYGFEDNLILDMLESGLDYYINQNQ